MLKKIILATLLSIPFCAQANILPAQVYLDQPYFDNKQLISWSNNSGIDLFRFNAHNYKQKLLYNKSFFTESGWENYLSILSRLKTLDTIQKDDLNLFAHITEPSKILKQGVTDMHYWWDVSQGLTLFYENKSQVFQQQIQLTMHIERVKPAISTEGVAITSITMQF